ASLVGAKIWLLIARQMETSETDCFRYCGFRETSITVMPDLFRHPPRHCLQRLRWRHRGPRHKAGVTENQVSAL
ncbi:hypothetical protein ACTGXS_10960, partial [Streptococcus suis]